MKAKLIAIALAGLLGAGTIGTASAIEGTGVVVYDPTGVAKMLDQIEQLKQQLATQKATYKSLTKLLILGNCWVRLQVPSLKIFLTTGRKFIAMP